MPCAKSSSFARQDAETQRRREDVKRMATSPKEQIFAPLRLCARPIFVARQDTESAEGQVEIA